MESKHPRSKRRAHGARIEFDGLHNFEVTLDQKARLDGLRGFLAKHDETGPDDDAARSNKPAKRHHSRVPLPDQLERQTEVLSPGDACASRKLFTMSEMRLHDPAVNRLYLNAEERAAFLAVARRQPARDRILCEVLHWTGCRPSELLEITPARVDLSGGTIAIRSLKKRKDASRRSPRPATSGSGSFAAQLTWRDISRQDRPSACLHQPESAWGRSFF